MGPGSWQTSRADPQARGICELPAVSAPTLCLMGTPCPKVLAPWKGEDTERWAVIFPQPRKDSTFKNWKLSVRFQLVGGGSQSLP